MKENTIIQKIKNCFSDKEFYKAMLVLAVPIIVQNLISTSLNMVDTLMIGRLGEVELAAVGLANKFYFFFSLVLFGIYSGSGIFMAQFHGKKDGKSIKKVMGLSLAIGLVISIIFSVLAIVTPEFVLSIFSEDKSLIHTGSQYLKIVGFSFVLNGIAYGYAIACRSVKLAKLPMVVSMFALGFNTVLNAILIFGMFGIVPLGVRGAAIATLIARIIEFVLIVGIIYYRKLPLAVKFKDFKGISNKFMRNYIKIAMPVMIHEGLWSLGMTMYAVAYARIGTDSVAAIQISGTIEDIFFVVIIGVANACAVMIGNKIGEGKKEVAIEYSKKFAILGIIFGVLMGILIAILAPLIVKLFKINDHTAKITIIILYIKSVSLIFKFFNTVLFVGILRSGGDTKFALILEISAVWGIGVTLAFFCSMVLKMPVQLVVIFVSLEEVFKTIVGTRRMKSNKWIREVV